MNDSELDDLLAAAAPISDAELAARLLSGPDTDLCEAIMSTPVIETTETTGAARTGAARTGAARSGGTRRDPDAAEGRRPRGPRRRLLAVGAAAAALAVAVSAGVLTVGSSERVDAATVQTALTNLAEELESSGRAEVHESIQSASPDAYDAVWNVAFSGGDSEATYDSDVIKRVVDGETYYAISSEGHGPPGTSPDVWIHLPDNGHWAVEKTAGWWGVEAQPDTGTVDVSPNVDPQDLLETLSPTGSFDVVGNEEVDGVPTRRLRATNPEATPALSFGNVVYEGAVVTALEVWVDDDEVVRRLDFTLDIPAHESDPDDVTGWPDSTNTYSIRFFDLGAPITIDAPEDYLEFTGSADG